MFQEWKLSRLEQASPTKFRQPDKLYDVHIGDLKLNFKNTIFFFLQEMKFYLEIMDLQAGG